MVSYKWGGWSQSVARSFFHLLPGVWLDMQNLLPGQVSPTISSISQHKTRTKNTTGGHHGVCARRLPGHGGLCVPQP